LQQGNFFAMTSPIEIQGHRGARARRPENTLPSFEAALDACVASIETDLQFTKDCKIILSHDSRLNPFVCAVIRKGKRRRFRQFARIAEFRGSTLQRFIADGNPDPQRFPDQSPERTALSEWFAQEHFRPPHDPYAIPTLGNLFDFVDAYAGEPGERDGKTEVQRANAQRIILDLEVKNEPFEARASVTILQEVAAIIAEKEKENRCRFRSFDHRLVRRFQQIMPVVEAGILITGTVPVDPVQLTWDANATYYFPDYRCLDEEQLERLHRADIRVIPWTVNEKADWRRLLKWGVDGITTDDPQRLAAFLSKHLRKRNQKSPPTASAGL
jgi:glycerophosphoryl diester phosphodiesterase